VKSVTPIARVTLRPLGAGFDPKPLWRSPVRALRGGDDGVAFAFAPSGGALEVTVLAAGVLDAVGDDDVERAVRAARGIAGVDDDPSDFLAKVRGHAVLGPLAMRCDVRLTRTPTVFESFAEAVLAQLVTGEEARDAKRRLWAHAGLVLRGTRLRAAPTASAVRRVPSWTMHAMGIASRRFLTLHEGAKRGVAIERIAAGEPAEFMERLMSLRGVGPWTANRVARAALAYPDAVPIGDLHVPRLVTEALTGERDGTNETMLAALEPFRPDRARVVRLLERMHFAGDTRRAKVDPHRREPWRF
jgi:3-methyladenine DNA glycosylase/8-oxoguanine DNA glycosylase